jgi:hypothetical protein
MSYVNRLFFRKDTGSLIYRYSMMGDIIVSTVEQDLQAIAPLKDYNAGTIEVVEISQDDLETQEKVNTATGIRLDVETKELIFDFTPEQIEEQQREATLEEQVAELQQLVADLASLQLGV